MVPGFMCGHVVPIEDERELWEQGDINTMLRNVALYVAKLAASSASRSDIDFDDLFQEAMIAAWKSLRVYDPEKARFVGLARNAARWRLSELNRSAHSLVKRSQGQTGPKPVVVRHGGTQKQRGPFDPQRGRGFGSSHAPWDCKRIAESRMVEARDRRLESSVASALRTLSEREQQILHKRYLGDTLQEVGDSYGLTRERIRQIEKKALHRLREIVG